MRTGFGGFREGTLITLTTPDEDGLPLSNHQLLALHNAICKVEETCGEEVDDYYSDEHSTSDSGCDCSSDSDSGLGL
jgi:hypothetical protein